jgi:mono/diheme cytochrome c family protein
MKFSLALLSLLATITLMSSAQAGDTQVLEKGKKLYLANCARCHGVNADGTGDAGQNLTPPPANLSESLKNKIVTDDFLLWTIREGGENIHTDMPAFETEGLLDESDAKAIVRYLRTAFK